MTVHTYKVEILTPDMFGEMQRYEHTYEVYDRDELEHHVFEWYGEIEFTVLEHDTHELEEVA